MVFSSLNILRLTKEMKVLKRTCSTKKTVEDCLDHQEEIGDANVIKDKYWFIKTSRFGVVPMDRKTNGRGKVSTNFMIPRLAIHIMR